MDEQVELREVYIDFLPNQPKNEIFRQYAAERLRQQLEGRPEASVDRQWELPQLIVKPEGEYLELLLEARDLYINGYFYSCVATCGIVGEWQASIGAGLERKQVVALFPRSSRVEIELMKADSVAPLAAEESKGSSLSSSFAKCPIDL